ncbi:MAG: metallophosphoesterase family protein [Longibaculum sp.]
MKVKKIVVMSDNHGMDEMIERVKELEPHADYYVHCGDSEASYQQLLNGFICVKGNNDWALDLPLEAKFIVEDIPILITHGHLFGFFNRELAMNDALTRNECQILLCGHTHMPMFQKDGSYYYINPGSTSLPRGGSSRSYCVVTIDQGQVDCEFKNI